MILVTKIKSPGGYKFAPLVASPNSGERALDPINDNTTIIGEPD